jgi:two-component system sensor histidine kinase HydH
LDALSLARHFVDKLREVIGASRIALFLEGSDYETSLPGGKHSSTRFECVASAGMPADLADCFSLNRLSGIGQRLCTRPEILRDDGESVAADPHILREFEVLNGRVAMPVGDRDRILGVAVLGGRLTGGAYSDQELLLVYHLLEELGLAVKNSRLHQQIVAGHKLVAQMLEGLTVGAAAIGPDQRVIYANRALRALLPGTPGTDFTIHDVPATLAARIHDVVEKGAESAPFFHETEGPRPVCLRVSVVPLEGVKSAARTVLLLLEDFTPVRAAQKAEIESAGLRLTSLIARRFAHEIRNSLVPLSTHAQLFDAEIGDTAFRASLKGALEKETGRILRFTEQMLLLARAEPGPTEALRLVEVLRDSFDKAIAGLGRAGDLEIAGSGQAARIIGSRPALTHAFQEIFFNGLQSSVDENRRIFVSLEETRDTGTRSVLVRVRDSGSGFSSEVAPRATEAFFTTRNTGVGLGLTIAQRVLEAHSGAIDVRPRRDAADFDIVIRLPQAP